MPADWTKTTGVNNYRYRPIEVRLQEGIKKADSGCWEWQGAARTKIKTMPYGGIKIFQKTHLVHRVSYEHYIGPIPEGMQVLHKCDNPKCINPEHLFIGTNLDNVADKLKKGRQAVGDKCATSKLTSNDVIEIRGLALLMSRRKVAKKFKISHNTVNGIVNRTSWKHIA